MFVSIVVVLLVLAALVAEGSSAVGDNALVLICLLLMAGFFGVVAAAQRDREKNEQTKFGNALTKARKRSTRRTRKSSRYRWTAVGWVLGISLVAYAGYVAYSERSSTPVAVPSTTALTLVSHAQAWAPPGK